MQKWRDAHPNYHREHAIRWQKDNRPRATANNARYLAAKIRATPAWADSELIYDFYALAAAYVAAGIPCEVDHIVPLRGKRVSGLHVPANLQLLSPNANLAKGNRHVV